MLSENNARLAAARRLTRRRSRREAGLFLAEGAPSVREALRRPGTVLELFATAAALDRNAGWLDADRCEQISERSAAALSETVSPQGLVAVCRLAQPSAAEVLARSPRLLAVLVEPNDPGNLGTVIRTADAAGADAVFIDGGADPYCGKAVRASAGSLFHLPVLECGAAELLSGIEPTQLTALATSGRGADDLDELAGDGTLARPSAWLFGDEAHGLPDSVLRSAPRTVRIPIHGRAESLNLAAAAAVCLYASARAQRGSLS
ncbi:MAG: TrmH family RNA methyltransferase [Jatrophihabitantaceae bacterium]